MHAHNAPCASATCTRATTPSTLPPDPTQRVPVCAGAAHARGGRGHRDVPRQPDRARAQVPPQLRRVRGRVHEQRRALARLGLPLLARPAHHRPGGILPLERRRVHHRHALGRDPRAAAACGARGRLPGAVPHADPEPRRQADGAAQFNFLPQAAPRVDHGPLCGAAQREGRDG